MKKNKVHLSARISPLAAEMLEAEKQKTGETEGAIIARCLVEALSAHSPAALARVKQYIEGDAELRMLSQLVRNVEAVPNPTLDAALDQIQQAAQKAAQTPPPRPGNAASPNNSGTGGRPRHK